MLKIAEVKGVEVFLSVEEKSLYCEGVIVEDSKGLATLENYADVCRGIWHSGLKFEEIQY